MKAAIRKGLLGFSYAISDSHPKPAFHPSTKNADDIYIKISAASINPVDYKLPRAALGKVIGLDFCGTVTAVGDRVAAATTDDDDKDRRPDLKVGDLVFGQSSSGSVAEYAIAAADKTAKVVVHTAPGTTNTGGGWTPTEYAALSVAYQSALQCLRRSGIITVGGDTVDANTAATARPGTGTDRSVLVVGASGGCGVAGLQLCRAVGGVSRIVAVCSKKNARFVTDMGATEVVDYTDLDELDGFFRDNVGSFDAVYDAANSSGAGEDYWGRCIPLLRENTDVSGGYNGGRYVALNGSKMKWIRAIAGWEKPGQSLLLCSPNTADLKLIVSLLDRTGDRPVTNIVPFDEEGLTHAFDGLKSRRTKGKIVFDISS